jgi:hypothetical protein
MVLLLDSWDEKLIYMVQELHSSVFTLQEKVKLFSKLVKGVWRQAQRGNCVRT